MVKRKDAGAIEKLLCLIVLTWVVVCWGVLLQIIKAGYVNRYLEDCLTQANLAALLVEPYVYGSTGELVFEDLEKTRELFWETLNKSLGEQKTRNQLGISDVEVLDFRVYEVTREGSTEYVFGNGNSYIKTNFLPEVLLKAPDGTEIQSSSIYAKIAVSTHFIFGIEVTAMKEHCVDIVSEEVIYE